MVIKQATITVSSQNDSVSKRAVGDAEFTPHSGEDSVASLVALVRVIGASWHSIACFVIVGFVGAALYLHLTTYCYSATLTVVAVQQPSESRDTPLVEFASAVGINVSRSQRTSPFSLYPDVLVSRAVADDITQQTPEILHRVFSSDWDKKRQQWRHPSSPLFAAKTLIKSFLGIPIDPWQPPGAADLREIIERDVTIDSPDSRKPILTLTYQNADPNFARRFLDQVNEAADRVLRRMILNRSSNYAQYLENKLRVVQAADLRQALISLYDQQEALMMMSSSNTPFSVQPLGGAAVTLRPTSPKPLFVLAIGFLLGLTAGIADAVLEWRLVEKIHFAKERDRGGQISSERV